jgi:hypothetical protein
MPRVQLFYLLHLWSRLSFKCAPAPIAHFCIGGHPHCRDSVHDAAGAFEKSKGLLNNQGKKGLFSDSPPCDH